MTIITVTAQVNEKNTRTASTAKGDKKIISVPLFEKEKGSNVKVAYGSAFLPDFIQLGDIVTVSGRVQAKESGEYVNYNFVFPTVAFQIVMISKISFFVFALSSSILGYPSSSARFSAG